MQKVHFLHIKGLFLNLEIALMTSLFKKQLFFKGKIPGNAHRP